jgi:hypothetical protein
MSKSCVVSLGSNCSVTLWLNKLKLRKNAFPFDWSSLNIKILNNIIKNKFSEYLETLQILYVSDKHPNELGNSTMLITNKYKIRYAHEVITSDLNDFLKSLDNRIKRFYELENEDFITYVRIELSIVSNSYIKELEILIKLLDTVNPNYIIKLIIHKDSVKITLDKVQIYYYDSFSSDWKMDHLDWSTILLD